jgi:flagellar biogenesis protein FliO
MEQNSAELIFISGMMILILIMCVVACYLFFRQLIKEKREQRECEQTAKSAPPESAENAEE